MKQVTDQDLAALTKLIDNGEKWSMDPDVLDPEDQTVIVAGATIGDLHARIIGTLAVDDARAICEARKHLPSMVNEIRARRQLADSSTLDSDQSKELHALRSAYVSACMLLKDTRSRLQEGNNNLLSRIDTFIADKDAVKSAMFATAFGSSNGEVFRAIGGRVITKEVNPSNKPGTRPASADQPLDVSPRDETDRWIFETASRIFAHRTANERNSYNLSDHEIARQAQSALYRAKVFVDAIKEAVSGDEADGG